MTLPETIIILWFLLTISFFLLAWSLASLKKLLLADIYSKPSNRNRFSRVHCLTPVKGVFPGLRQSLVSLLEQDYPDYALTFIVESEDDRAAPLIRELCLEYSHANIIYAGPAQGCGQKNHNLIMGVRSIKEPPEILVFCDSTNRAAPDWLKCLTSRIDAGILKAVTTFRSFDPSPPTLGGVCQAIYATSVSIIAPIQNSPWGGGSAISWELFKDMDVTSAWSDTVIDDLVLGNCLVQAGARVIMDLDCSMTTRLSNQSISACMGYLDRQIMFPKFTNPWSIWAPVIFILGNLGVALTCALVFIILSVFGWVSFKLGLAGLVLLTCLGLVAIYLKRRQRQDIPSWAWAVWFAPSIMIIAYISLRSIFRNYIIWHGKTYWCGKGGRVIKMAAADR
jgi:hypothetical protein